MTNKRRFGNQNYAKIKRTCIKKGQLFVDTVFPPTNASLFLEQGRSSDIVWKRPAELHSDPHLFVEGASPNDVTQGILGNCWFVSACSALTHNQHLLNRVIPNADSQEWSPKNCYAGVFRFRFWRFGRWVEVVIDDLLPTRDGSLLFARSKTPNEFWSALLEKAFAKLYGCYESLVGGHLSDALQDVSGGVAETVNVAKFLKAGDADAPDCLFKNLKEAFDNEALIVAAIAANTKDEIEQTLSCGLVKGHAYAVTAVKYVELDANSNTFRALFGHHDRVRMIRLQNPWGEKEWNGPWSDDSKEWDQVTISQQISLGITKAEDGDFWMPWYSFVQYFTDISVCQLFNTRTVSTSRRYHEAIYYGEWTTNGVKRGAPDYLAGGCYNFSTFCNNPQVCPVSALNDACFHMFSPTTRPSAEWISQPRSAVTICMQTCDKRVQVQARIIYVVHCTHQDYLAKSTYPGFRNLYGNCDNLFMPKFLIFPGISAPGRFLFEMLIVYSSYGISEFLLVSVVTGKKRSIVKHFFVFFDTETILILSDHNINFKKDIAEHFLMFIPSV
ncbi:unnamed protein product [Cylicocyclus nassatus]|uniref:Calpain catalytic domain-containing protein n=1 Tax=Cylicocyclus nassatus TaxID=53992 RepID=A0AA36HFD5_CYLNA|nr:unnamed protein product [Cylicocyclus nassatus]